MSTQITLNVPAGFPMPALLTANNAEDNALILTNGCRVLADSRDASAGLNQADEKARLKAEAERTIAAALADHKKAMEALKADADRALRDQTAEAARLLKVATMERAALEKQIAAARSEAAASAIAAAAASQAIATAQASGKAEAEALLMASVTKAEKSAAEALQAKDQADRNLLAAVEKAAAAAKAERERAAAEAKVERDSAAERERVAAAEYATTLLRLTARQAGSSTKGADNEHALNQVVAKAFSVLPTYVEHPKKLESGDMLFTFEGVKFMVEGKDYAKTVPEAEVLKANRDMARAECDALLFVSEHSGIQGRMECGSNTHICTVEGKASAFISKFAEEHDKVAHLQMVVRTLIAFCRLQKSVSVADADAVEAKQQKITTLQRLFRESSADIHKIKQALLSARRTMNGAMDGLTSTINIMIETFKCRLAEAQSDGVAAESAASEAASMSDGSVDPPPAKRVALEALKGDALVAKAKDLGIKHSGKKASVLRDLIFARL